MDPSEARRAEKASRSEVVVNGFEAVVREWHSTIHLSQVSAGHAARTLIRLEQDVFPWLGGLPVGEIKAPQLLQTIRRIEARGAIETAHRALQACGQVFRYAIATGRAERDPAPDLRGALKPVLVQHMAAITDPKRVGELLRAIESYKGMPITRAALQLAPLVFVRPGELRKAEWIPGFTFRPSKAQSKRDQRFTTFLPGARDSAAGLRSTAVNRLPDDFSRKVSEQGEGLLCCLRR